MGNAILNWLTGGLLDKVLGYFAAREQAKLDTMNNAQRQQHEERMQARQSAKEIRLATAGFWEMRLLTFLIALPFVGHLWAVWIDTQWPQPWNVEAFPPPFDEWEGAILLSFFGVAVAGAGLKSIAGAIAYRKK